MALSAEDHRDLPILDELDAEFRALVRTELAGERRRPDVTIRRVAPRRVARRAALVLVLVCLVGTVAFAASQLHSDARSVPSDSAPTPLGEGRGPDGAWRLAGYRHDGRLCLLFTLGGDATSECSPAASARDVRAIGSLGVTRRYVVGLAGGEVARVLVRVGGLRLAPATHAPADAAAAHAAGIPAGMRWFVAAVGASTGRAAVPAWITPRDNTGRALGPTVLDCSLGIVGAPCKRQLRRIAGGKGGGRGG